MARKKVLILTVGGSPEPLLNAVRTARPDHVVFICSGGKRGSEQAVDGSGHPFAFPRPARCPACEHEFPTGSVTGPSLVAQLGLEAALYTKCLVSPDDMDGISKALLEVERRLDEDFPGADVALNFTGGTKIMSAALLLMGLRRPDWCLQINVGPRVDLIKVHGGDTVVTTPANVARLEQKLSAVRPLLAHHSYGAAESAFRFILSKTDAGSPEFLRLARLATAAAALDAWDRFDHGAALESFTLYRISESLKDLFSMILALNGKQKKAGPYVLVWDILANADRRAIENRYDDAVARLYRATELLAQIRLEEAYKLDTSDLDRSRLPSGFAGDLRKDEGEKLQVGLHHAWDLLAQLDDPLGALWKERRASVLDTLSVRNYSILAHGIKPVGEGEYRNVAHVLGELIEEGCKTAGSPVQPVLFPGEDLLALGPC